MAHKPPSPTFVKGLVRISQQKLVMQLRAAHSYPLSPHLPVHTGRAAHRLGFVLAQYSAKRNSC